MSLALYIALKNKPEDLDDFMNGKALAHAWEQLDALAPVLNARSLSALCTPAWKKPDKGVADFEKYLAYVQENPDAVPDAEGVIEDLQDAIRLIGEAKRLGTKWRLLVDY